MPLPIACRVKGKNCGRDDALAARQGQRALPNGFHLNGANCYFEFTRGLADLVTTVRTAMLCKF